MLLNTAKDLSFKNGVKRGLASWGLVALGGLEDLAFEAAGAGSLLARTAPVVSSAAANAASSTFDVLGQAAGRAFQKVGLVRRGPVYGTRAHTAFAEEVNALGRSDLSTEVSYMNGRIVPYGTKGSVRLDVVEGSPTAPTAVYDLKTGSATLTPDRINQIRANLPGGGTNVPVLEVR
jgi:hypothetical protein